MTDRAVLVRAIQQARDGRGLAAAVAALDTFDRDRRAQHAQDRELDFADGIVTARLAPVTAHERHTAATDWLADYEAPADYRVPMIAEASAWIQGLDREVLRDTEEFTAQALGRAGTLASRYGEHAAAARSEFLSCVAYLSAALQKGAASGLPQIQQTIDPNNQPSTTPLPTGVFENFAPPVNDYNGGVEGENHDSSISSQSAPFLQQVQQQDGSGSGFGGGPEKPVTHTTQMDTSNSYAEVPLGTPGQIPTTPAPTSQAGGMSTPNPVAGSDQVADDDHLQNAMGRQGSWSAPDKAGFRWVTSSAYAEAPFHLACQGDHWPDERCGGQEHTASVAIGYSQSFEDVARNMALEGVGMEEGRRVLASSRTPADLLAHHNRLVTAFASSEREADDAAVLHGFLAVVRPVLAGGDPGGLASGGVTKSERENATHHLPGTDKFPVDSAADVENAKHDIGRTNEPKSKVVNYINDMAKEYGEPPVGGDDDDDDDSDDKDKD